MRKERWEMSYSGVCSFIRCKFISSTVSFFCSCSLYSILNPLYSLMKNILWLDSVFLGKNCNFAEI